MERLGIRVMKRTVGYMAFPRALSINLLPRAILEFVYMCLLTGRFTLGARDFSSAVFGFCQAHRKFPPHARKTSGTQGTVVLMQSNFHTPGYTSRSDTNWVSRAVQPIFRDICFSCSRAITIHQVIAIFLQFHCLSSYRNDYFPLQLIDQITFLLSRQMCHVN